jgi:hypothetical protein
MVKNMTPHPIHLYNKDDTFYDVANRKYFVSSGATPIMTIPPSGILLNAKGSQIEKPSIDGIPIKAIQWVVDDFVPEEGVYYIVSALFKTAYTGPNREQFLTIGDAVYDSVDNPRPIGCLFLAQ